MVDVATSPKWPWGRAPVETVESFAACRRWGCDHCSKGKRAEVFRHIEEGLAAQWETRRPRMLTVTFADPLQVDNPGDVSEARRRVSELIREVRRRLGRDLEYSAVVEPTKRGRVHFHLLTTTPRSWPKLPKCSGEKGEPFRCECPDTEKSRMPYRGPCLQKLAHRVGCGWVDIREVKSPKRGAWYLVKYLTKDTIARRLPPYTRRYAYSRQWSDDTLGSVYRRWLEGVRAEAAEAAAARGESLPGWKTGDEWVAWEWRPLPRGP